MKPRSIQWLLLLPCLPVLTAWDNFIVPAGTSTSDILISHYPNLLFLQRSLATGQGIPLWSPLILSGYPFAANPLSSLWYPPAWLSLIFPLPLGINLVMTLHIGLGSLGMYHLLKRLDVSENAAVLGGILYGLLPSGYSHAISGHFTWVCASAWFPWLLASGLSHPSRDRKPVIQAAVYLGLMLLADMRFAAYAAMFWLILGLFHAFNSVKAGLGKVDFRRIGNNIFSLLLAAGISAAVWIPLIEYANLSTRSLLTSQDTFFLSLPVVQLTGLVVPGHPQSFEWIIYPGAGCLLLSLGGLMAPSRRRELVFWYILGIACLIWALGDAIPINQWLATLPGFDLLRVPARGMFFFVCCLLITAMISLDRLIKERPQKVVLLRLGTFFLFLFALLIQIFVAVSNPQKNGILLGHIVLWSLTAGLILMYSYRRVEGRIFLLLAGGVICADLFLADINMMNLITPTKALTAGQDEIIKILDQGNDFRVFSPSYSIPQQTSAYYGVELADGIDPLQLKTYADTVKTAMSLKEEGYSVTLPSFKTGDTRNDNRGIKPDSRVFGRLNVKYLVSAFPIDSLGWEETGRNERSFIYKNTTARGWAWMEPADLENGDEFRIITNLKRSPNYIRIEAEGPGRLVLSEIFYPGWQARADGQPVAIEPFDGLLRSVRISEGKHQIEFIYLPEKVFAGVGLSLLSILLCILLQRVHCCYAK